MNEKEASLYRWMECLTIAGGALADDSWQAGFALTRRYAERTPDGLRLTEAGNDWFQRRAAFVTANCEQGAHDFRPKVAGGESLHCIWCGVCESRPCEECAAYNVRLIEERVPLRRIVGHYIDASGDYHPKYEDEPGEDHHDPDGATGEPAGGEHGQPDGVLGGERADVEAG